MLVSFCCLDLYLWMASSLLSLCGSILCKGSGICLLSSSFTAVKSCLDVEIRVSYISATYSTKKLNHVVNKQ